jgi:hypothetical protein
LRNIGKIPVPVPAGMRQIPVLVGFSFRSRSRSWPGLNFDPGRPLILNPYQLLLGLIEELINTIVKIQRIGILQDFSTLAELFKSLEINFDFLLMQLENSLALGSLLIIRALG